VRRALDRYAERISAMANVVGLGIGADVGMKKAKDAKDAELYLAVYVSEKWPRERLADEDVVPSRLEIDDHVVRTRVIEVGTFKPEGGDDAGAGFTKG
jgi:hypothetical protein